MFVKKETLIFKKIKQLRLSGFAKVNTDISIDKVVEIIYESADALLNPTATIIYEGVIAAQN